MKKILIGVPCMNQVPAEFADSLARLTSVGAPECKLGLIFKIGSLIYAARDDIAMEAIKSEADYVMWFDSDMTFPPDTLQRLMKHMERDDVDIVTGLYFRRVEPYTPVLFDKLERTNEGIIWSDFSRIDNELFEIGGCGFGCVLMKTEVFMGVFAKYKQMFTPFMGAGEDIALCIRARECGYRIWCDPTISLGHIGYHTVTRNFFLEYQARQEAENAGESEASAEN